MKLTLILFKQHIGRQIRSKWYFQGRRTINDTPAEKILASRGVQIFDAMQLMEKPPQINFNFKEIDSLAPKSFPLDNTHPDWKDRICLTLGDNDLLTMGLAQAQQITKTIVFKNQLPDTVESKITDIPENIHDLVKRTIETSVIFDAHQELLPKIKDPNRPAFVFSRQMGITDVRKSENLTKKLIQLGECLSGPEISKSRSIIDYGLLSFPFEKEFDLFQFKLTMDMMLMSTKPLSAAKELNKEECKEMKLPSLHPIHHAIGFDEENIYKLENLYPLVSGYHKKYLHTIVLSYDKTKVKHKSELATKGTQHRGRILLKAFTAAACSARQRYGVDIKELPEPQTIQCIESDGKEFHFSVYQLNSLDLDDEKGLKNFYWILPKLDLYTTGGYVSGKPVLDDYNPEVFKKILAFYKNS